MRIGSSIPLLPTTVYDRGYGVGRNPGAAEATESAVETAPRNEVTRIRSRNAPSEDASLSRFADRNLSQRSRDALQSYLANGPTLTERLGVELAGIDVQV